MLAPNLGPWLVRTLAKRCIHVTKESNVKASCHVMNNKQVPTTTNLHPFLQPSVSAQTVMKILDRFEKDKTIKTYARKQGITKTLFQQSMKNFRRACTSNSLSMDTIKLRHILHGISTEKYPLNALLSFFMEQSHEMYPAVKHHDKIKEISDMTKPTLWYPKARSISRNITFHVGPTNSGKTHAALERFFEAENAVYCSPLRLLAREICEKSRSKGVSCDMITGDDKDFTHGSSRNPATKVSCTVEMTDLNKRYDVAVIDEIQMLSDLERGWAWTRAFLGLCAKEIHVCGEARALEVICSLAEECNDELNIREYKRLGQLRVKKNPVECLEKVRPGDCIVCFNKEEIFGYKRSLSAAGIESAIIYGSLPPFTKLEEARKFNDPSHPCNVLVTTDAIGMGLNLNIKRIIFNDIKKTMLTKGGEKRTAQLSSSQVLQISGRAGRYGSEYPDGAVTAMHKEHQKTLLQLLRSEAKIIERVGLLPSFERLEQFSNLLKSKSLHDVLTVFISKCEMDTSLYFLCSLKECQEIAQVLSKIDMTLRDMYTFCLSPVSTNRSFVMAVLKIYAEYYAKNWETTDDDVRRILKWPPRPARNKREVSRLEEVHESLRLYLWLSYRFPKAFTKSKEIRAMKKKVDYLTKISVAAEI